MTDEVGLRALVQELRHELAEKSRQLSELEVMLEDYQDERGYLIRDLRRLNARLREAEEQLPRDRDQFPGE